MIARALALAVILAGCSSKKSTDRPVLDGAMRERLKAVAPSCEETSGQPKVDRVLKCVAADAEGAVAGVFLLEDNQVVQLWLEISAPTLDAGAAKLGPLLAGFVDDAARDTILATVRTTGPDPGYARAPELGRKRDAVVYVKAPEVGGVRVTLQLMFDIPVDRLSL